jgi:hypothetical protein
MFGSVRADKTWPVTWAGTGVSMVSSAIACGAGLRRFRRVAGALTREMVEFRTKPMHNVPLDWTPVCVVLPTVLFSS